MATIIPRWEWRTFGSDFKGADKKIMDLGPSVKKSGEKYILSRNSNENCKIRDDLMDIKSPVNVNEDKLEQWYPTMKLSFPLSKEQVTELFSKYFKVEVPELAESYDGVYFVDCNGPFCDENGYLYDYMSMDGEHLLPDYSVLWAEEIRRQAIVD